MLDGVAKTVIRDLTDDEVALISGGYSSDIEIICGYPIPPDFGWSYWIDTYDNGYYYDYDSGGYVGYGGGGTTDAQPADNNVPPPPPPIMVEGSGVQHGGTGWDPASSLMPIP